MTTASLNVLLVDDDDVAAESVIRGLQKASLNLPVVLAEDGQIALEILRGQHPERRINKPLLVLLDLNMPRMNGFEFLENMRNDPDLRETVVFVLTTSSADSDRSKAYYQNIAGYMVKSAVGPQFSKLSNLLDSYLQSVKLP